MDAQIDFQLRNLDAAVEILRRNLHTHCIDATARAHMIRAVAHIHEAFIATNEIGKARTVEKLTSDMEKTEAMIHRLSANQKQAALKIR